MREGNHQYTEVNCTRSDGLPITY